MTPEQLRNHTFKSAGKGLLHAEEVEQVLEAAAKELQTRVDAAKAWEQKNAELYKRIQDMADTLTEYRSERDTVQRAFIHAQKISDDMLLSAKEESERLSRESRENADKLTAQSRAEAAALIEKIRSEIEKTKQDSQARAEALVLRAQAKADLIAEQAGSAAQAALRKLEMQKLQAEEDCKTLQEQAASLREKLILIYRSQIKQLEVLPTEPQAPAEAQHSVPPTPAPSPVESAPQLEPIYSYSAPESAPDPDPEPTPENIEPTASPAETDPQPLSGIDAALAELEAMESENSNA